MADSFHAKLSLLCTNIPYLMRYSRPDNDALFNVIRYDHFTFKNF